MVDDGSAQPAAIKEVADVRCSFCGKHHTDVDQIVCGPTPAVAICNECVALCGEIMAEQRGAAT